MNKFALLLVIIGALNWLLIGIFQFDLVFAIGGGQSGIIARIIFCIIGLAGIWAISFWPKVGKASSKN